MQPIQIKEHDELFGRYIIATGDYKGAEVADISPNYGQFQVYDLASEAITFVSTSVEVCQLHIVGLAYMLVSNKMA